MDERKQSNQIQEVTHLSVMDSENGMGSAAGLMNVGGCRDSVYTRREN